MCCSQAVTAFVAQRKRLFLPLAFLVKIWLRLAARLLIRPLLLTLKRFTAPFMVFIFAMIACLIHPIKTIQLCIFRFYRRKVNNNFNFFEEIRSYVTDALLAVVIDQYLPLRVTLALCALESLLQDRDAASHAPGIPPLPSPDYPHL